MIQVSGTCHVTKCKKSKKILSLHLCVDVKTMKYLTAQLVFDVVRVHQPDLHKLLTWQILLHLSMQKNARKQEQDFH